MPPKTNVNYARSYQVLVQSINALVKPSTPANAPVVPLATVTTVMTWVSQNGGATTIKNAIAAADNIRARIGRSWPTNANNNNRAMPPNTPAHPASGLRIAWLDPTALATQASRKQFCENLAGAYVTQGFHRDMNTCTPVQGITDILIK